MAKLTNKQIEELKADKSNLLSKGKIINKKNKHVKNSTVSK